MVVELLNAVASLHAQGAQVNQAHDVSVVFPVVGGELELHHRKRLKTRAIHVLSGYLIFLGEFHHFVEELEVTLKDSQAFGSHRSVTLRAYGQVVRVAKHPKSSTTAVAEHEQRTLTTNGSKFVFEFQLGVGIHVVLLLYARHEVAFNQEVLSSESGQDNIAAVHKSEGGLLDEPSLCRIHVAVVAGTFARPLNHFLGSERHHRDDSFVNLVGEKAQVDHNRIDPT